MLCEQLAFSDQETGYLWSLSTTSRQIGTDFRFPCFQACNSSVASSSTPSDTMSKSRSAGATCSNRHRCALLEDQVRFLHLLGAQLLLATKPQKPGEPLLGARPGVWSTIAKILSLMETTYAPPSKVPRTNQGEPE